MIDCKETSKKASAIDDDVLTLPDLPVIVGVTWMESLEEGDHKLRRCTKNECTSVLDLKD